jgi:hypothetical protein
MWDTTVRVEHELAVEAGPARVWAVAGSPAALSAGPGSFAFEVPADLAGTDRLCCLLTDGPKMTCEVHDVREEVAGQTVCWQARSTEPAGKQTLTLAVHPRPRGSALRLATSDVVPKLQAFSHEAARQAQVRAWADSLRQIAEGRAPWPSAEMPVSMRQKCSAPRPLNNPLQVSESAVIHAPSAAVWEAVYAPESVRRMKPGQVAYACHVPGTPERRAGGMQYVVYRHPGERFTANVSVVTEVVEGVSAVSQNLVPPHARIYHRLTAVADGTRLEIECHWPAPVTKMAGKVVAADVAKQLLEAVEGYKAIIERPA